MFRVSEASGDSECVTNSQDETSGDPSFPPPILPLPPKAPIASRPGENTASTSRVEADISRSTATGAPLLEPENIPFSFSPERLRRFLNPKSVAAFYMSGGLVGLEKEHQTKQNPGSGVDNTNGIQPSLIASSGGQEGEPGSFLCPNQPPLTNRDEPSPARPQAMKEKISCTYSPSSPKCSSHLANRTLTVPGRSRWFSGTRSMTKLTCILWLASCIVSVACMPLTPKAIDATTATQEFQWAWHLVVVLFGLLFWALPHFLGKHEFFYGFAILPSTICYLAVTFGLGTLQQAVSPGIALMVFLGLFLKNITENWTDTQRRSALCFVLCAALLFAGYVAGRISGDTTSTSCAALFHFTTCAGSFLFGTAIFLPSLVLMVFILWCTRLVGHCFGYYFGSSDGPVEPASELEELPQPI